MRWLMRAKVYTFTELFAACVLTGVGVWWIK